MLLYLAFPDAIATERKQCVKVFASQTYAGHTATVGHRENHLSWTIVGADLYAATSCYKLPTFDRVVQRLRDRVVIPIGHMQMKELLFIRQRAVFVNLITADPLRVPFRDREEIRKVAIGRLYPRWRLGRWR